MTESEMMALVNPMKWVAGLFLLVWLVSLSIAASRQRSVAVDDSSSIKSYILGWIANVLALVIVIPITLGVQYALFFKGMTLSSASSAMLGWKIFVWASVNLLIGLLLLLRITGSPDSDYILDYIASNAVSMVFIVSGLLGFCAIFGAISPDTFYALKLYMQEYALNAFILACFIGFALWMFDVFSN